MSALSFSTLVVSLFVAFAGAAWGATPERGGQLDGNVVKLEQELSLEDRKHIQYALDRLSFLDGPIDGVFAKDTRKAISKWQKRQAVPVTGFLTREQAETLRKYGRKYWAKRPKSPQPANMPWREAVERCRSLCISAADRGYDKCMTRFDEIRPRFRNERWVLEGQRKCRDWHSRTVDRCIGWSGDNANQLLTNHLSNPQYNPNCITLD